MDVVGHHRWQHRRLHHSRGHRCRNRIPEATIVVNMPCHCLLFVARLSTENHIGKLQRCLSTTLKSEKYLMGFVFIRFKV